MNPSIFYKKIVAPVMTLVILTGCLGEEDTDSSSNSSLITVSGSLSGSSSSKVTSQSITYSDYLVYCVTFSSPPYAAQGSISGTGAFSLQMPKSTDFGCFINEASSNQPVASLVIEDTASGFGSETSNSMNLSSNANLGAVTLDLETGVASVPRTAIENQLAPVTNSMNPSILHNQAFTMSCVTTGNSNIDSACSDFIAYDGDSVFFRIMVASQGSNTVYGLGVWRSQADFTNCGGIDMTTSEQSNIESSDGISFSQVSTGSAFVDNQTNCPTRDGLTPSGMEDPENYYAAGPLSLNGSGATLVTESSNDFGGGCLRNDYTSVTFSPEGGGTYVGNFTSAENFVETNPGDCGSNTSGQATFLVRFTPQ